MVALCCIALCRVFPYDGWMMITWFEWDLSKPRWLKRLKYVASLTSTALRTEVPNTKPKNMLNLGLTLHMCAWHEVGGLLLCCSVLVVVFRFWLPLVMTNSWLLKIAIESSWVFPATKWWFSIVVLVYQRVTNLPHQLMNFSGTDVPLGHMIHHSHIDRFDTTRNKCKFM